MARDGLNKLEQEPMVLIQACGVQVAIPQCLRDPFVTLALQLQEPRMRAKSIPAAVERRDVRGDHLVLRSIERTVGEVHRRAGLDRFEKVGPQAHGAEDLRHHAGHALGLRSRIQLRERTRGLRLVDHPDPSHAPGKRPRTGLRYGQAALSRTSGISRSVTFRYPAYWRESSTTRR